MPPRAAASPGRRSACRGALRHGRDVEGRGARPDGLPRPRDRLAVGDRSWNERRLPLHPRLSSPMSNARRRSSWHGATSTARGMPPASTGFAAICIQHETDHLDGLVTFDRTARDPRRASRPPMRGPPRDGAPFVPVARPAADGRPPPRSSHHRRGPRDLGRHDRHDGGDARRRPRRAADRGDAAARRGRCLRRAGQAVRLANPRVVAASAELRAHEEASPNLPGVWARLDRPARVTVAYLDETGAEVDPRLRRASGPPRSSTRSTISTGGSTSTGSRR
jgi:peptide deformylase